LLVKPDMVAQALVFLALLLAAVVVVEEVDAVDVVIRPMDPLDHPAQTVNPAEMVSLDNLEMMGNPEMPAPLNNNQTGASTARLDQLVPPETLVPLATPEVLDNLDLPLKVVAPDSPDLLDPLDLPEIPDNPDKLDSPEPLDKSMKFPAQKDLPDHLDNQVNLETMDNLATQETQAVPVKLDLLVMLVAMETPVPLEIQAKTVMMVKLEDMALATTAHLHVPLPDIKFNFRLSHEDQQTNYIILFNFCILIIQAFPNYYSKNEIF